MDPVALPTCRVSLAFSFDTVQSPDRISALERLLMVESCLRKALPADVPFVAAELVEYLPDRQGLVLQRVASNADTSPLNVVAGEGGRYFLSIRDLE